MRIVMTCALTALAAAALAAPASAASDCAAAPLVNPFTAWQDTADYVLAPDGSIEGGARSWSLDGAAGAVEGNEPFGVGGADDHLALDLPAGSTATTAPMCIGPEHRTVRFFAVGATTGQLSVEALYRERDGRETGVAIGAIRGSGSWAPSDSVPMKLNERAAQFGGTLQVALRFTPRGPGGWRIDDVYVDPYRVR